MWVASWQAAAAAAAQQHRNTIIDLHKVRVQAHSPV